MGRIRRTATRAIETSVKRTFVGTAKWLLEPTSRRRLRSASKRVVAWFRARGRIAQVGIVLLTLAFSWALWSVLVVVVGFLLRGIVLRWLKAEAIARLFGWAKNRVLPGT
jgi:hypothetical protein